MFTFGNNKGENLQTLCGRHSKSWKDVKEMLLTWRRHGSAEVFFICNYFAIKLSHFSPTMSVVSVIGREMYLFSRHSIKSNSRPRVQATMVDAKSILWTFFYKGQWRGWWWVSQQQRTNTSSVTTANLLCSVHTDALAISIALAVIATTHFFHHFSVNGPLKADLHIRKEMNANAKKLTVLDSFDFASVLLSRSMNKPQRLLTCI